MLRIKHHTGTLPFTPIGLRLKDGNGETYKIVDELNMPNFNQGTSSDADSLLVVEREPDKRVQKISSIFLDNFLNEKNCSIIGGA